MPGKSRLRNGCATLIGIALLAGVGAAIFAINYRPDTDAIRGQFATRGYPVSLTELDSRYSRVPDSENGALLYLAAAASLEEMTGKDDAVLYSVAGYHVRNFDSPLEADDLDVIRRHLANNVDALRLAREAASLRSAYYAWGTEQVGAKLRVDSRSAGDTWDVVQLLILAGVIHAHDGEAEIATSDFIGAFAFVRSWGGVPANDLQTERTVLFDDAIYNIARSISVTRFTHEQLQRMCDAAVEAVRPDAGQQTLLALSGWLNDPEIVPDGPWIELATREWMLGAPLLLALVDAREQGLREAHDEVYSQLPGPRAVGVLEYFGLIPERAAFPNWYPVFVLFSPRVHLDLFRTVIAIEGFREQHHELPREIDQLVPEFMSELPEDPYTGNPYLYHQTNPGYAVYSPGHNHLDDGGARGSANSAGDIVLRVAR